MDGLSVQDAAAQLGLHPKTVRQQIKLGRLHARKVEGPHGPEWRVFPDGGPSADGGLTVNSPSVQGEAQAGPAPAIQALVDTIAQLREDHRAEVARLEKTNEALSQAAEHWQARFLEEHDRVLHLLPAPKEDEPAGDVAQPARRPWWKVWGR